VKTISKKYNHRSRNGTEFKSDDLEKGVTFTRLDGVSDERFAADCLEYGAMHALLVYPALNGFRGYDCIRAKEVAEVTT
jgi:hypothetical protein